MKLEEVGPGTAYAAGVVVTMLAIAELAVYAEMEGDVEGMSCYSALVTGLPWNPSHESVGRGLGIDAGLMARAISEGYNDQAARNKVIMSASPRLKRMLTYVGHDAESATAALQRAIES